MDETRTREHLANERTFLAWVRTSLGLIGLGFVLARMGPLLREPAATQAAGPGPASADLGREFLVGGIVFLLLGTALCGWAGRLYHRNRRAIETGAYVPTAAAVSGLTAVVVLAGLVFTALTVWRTIGVGP